MNFVADLMQPEWAYLIGFAQSDGHMSLNTRNRGRLQIEIGIIDKDILEKLQKLIPFNSSIKTRTRKTNFKQHTSVTLSVYALEFRNWLSKYIPYGKKHMIIEPPSVDFSERDYFRGLIDGDGSLGVTATGVPYISLITLSKKIAKAYINYITKITGKIKTSSRNSRDGAYNISLFRKAARVLINELYYNKCIGLQRKIKKSVLVINWIKENKTEVKKSWHESFWTKREDNILKTNSIRDATAKLDRNIGSIYYRRHVLGLGFKPIKVKSEMIKSSLK